MALEDTNPTMVRRTWPCFAPGLRGLFVLTASSLLESCPRMLERRNCAREDASDELLPETDLFLSEFGRNVQRLVLAGVAGRTSRILCLSAVSI